MTDIDPLLQLMARLRDPEHGCPWDLEQEFSTIAPYTIEEAYEVADAIARDDLAALRDELGDLLFQVAFHSRLAEEQGAFRFADVIAAIVDKMERRHPHVFGSARVASAAEQGRAWEQHKARERAADGPTGLLDGVARALPALVRAEKLQRRAARGGFDWPAVEPVFAKVEEELEEVRDEWIRAAPHERLGAEIGDLLFACVNLSRHLGIDAEAALREAGDRFTARFRHVEAAFSSAGQPLAGASPADLDAAWERAKRAEGAAADGAPDGRLAAASAETDGRIE